MFVSQGGIFIEYNTTHNTDSLRSSLVAGAQFSFDYEMPLLTRVNYLPCDAIPFENALRSKEFHRWIHFYQDDRRFECLWNTPTKYLPLLKRFSGVISPDYSIFREMPLALQMWNTYRNRALSFWMQTNGIKIVPNVRWGDERTYSFAFEGLPVHSSVAVSTNGCIQDKLDRYYFRKGLEKMIETLQPSAIINYSQTPSDIFDPYLREGLPILNIENYQITVRKAVK